MIAGRYRVECVLGSGGMGAVLAARHLQLDEAVALKFLHPHLAADAVSVERFFREARAASRIKSEHVVRVHDVGTTEAGLPYLAMELLEGTDLGDLVARGPLPVPLAVDCVLQAAEALVEAHAEGIVHRDIKPSNLWLTQRRDGAPLVKVLDFGISKLVSVDGDAKLTDTRAVFGSPAYMSPEQIRSAKRVDHGTDVWALGVVLFELLSGRVPFDADNVTGVLAAITADPPQPLRAHRAELSPELERVVLSALEKDPARRASLRELASGLRPFATAYGLVSADRIERAAMPASILPPRNPSPSVPSFAVTDTALVDPGPSRRRLGWRIGSAVVGVTVLAASALLLRSRPSPVVPMPVTSATAPASPPPPSASSALPPPASPSASSALPPPASPSATATTTAAPTAEPAPSTQPAPRPRTSPRDRSVPSAPPHVGTTAPERSAAQTAKPSPTSDERL